MKNRNTIVLVLVIAVLVVGAAYYLQKTPSPLEGTAQEGTAGIRGEAMVQVSEHPELGMILTGPDGMALYVFAKDDPNVSNCNDACAIAWPPLTLGNGQELNAGEGANGILGTTTRADGRTQIIYNTKPLYYYGQDKRPGDVTGDGVNDVWFVARP